MIGIVSYGAFIPQKRIRVDDIINVWKNNSADRIKNNLGVEERVVLGSDEDTVTLSIAAAKESLKAFPHIKDEIDSLYIGTCTNPYDSKPSSAILVDALKLNPYINCSDLQFSTKSGTGSIIASLGLVSGGISKASLAIGVDTINRHTSPGDLTEPYASAGASAFVIGNENVAIEIENVVSVVSDLSDNFRVEGERYIRSGMLLGSAKNTVGIYDHVERASKKLFEKLGVNAESYTYAVFQQPTSDIAYKCGKRLGFKRDQLEKGIVSRMIGDCGAASPLLGLINVLEQALPGDRILLVSYGFGAGADAISLKVNENILNLQGKTKTLEKLINDKKVVDYATSLKYEYKMIRPSHPITTYL